MRRLSLHFRLGPPRNAQAGQAQHQQVVGAVPDGEGLRQRDGMGGGEVEEGVAFVGWGDDGMIGGEDAG